MMNETNDMEMADVVVDSPPASQPPESTTNDVAVGFLSLARQLIQQGNPSQALQAVLMAMKTKGGDEAVVYILQRARELYMSKLQATSEADQLAALFAECVIAEAHPVRSDQSVSYPSPSLSPSPQPPIFPPNDAIERDAYGKSILVETGRKQIVLDAVCDGSSFICLQCGGLVSNHRKDEHYAHWCQS